MSKSYLPAYVFLYTQNTESALEKIQRSVGLKCSVDVQNSAPPYEKKTVKAWTSDGGERLCFENGCITAVVSFNLNDVLSHMQRVLKVHQAEKATVA